MNINELKMREDAQDILNNVDFNDIRLSASDIDFLDELEENVDEWEPLTDAQAERLQKIANLLGVG